MLKTMIATPLALALATTQSHAGFHTGFELLALSDNHREVYIAGIVDAGDTIATWSGVRFFCAPDGVTTDVVADIVRTYLLAHPMDLRLTASSNVLNALEAAFPCGGDK